MYVLNLLNHDNWKLYSIPYDINKALTLDVYQMTMATTIKHD